MTVIGAELFQPTDPSLLQPAFIAKHIKAVREKVKDLRHAIAFVVIENNFQMVATHIGTHLQGLKRVVVFRQPFRFRVGLRVTGQNWKNAAARVSKTTTTTVKLHKQLVTCNPATRPAKIKALLSHKLQKPFDINDAFGFVIVFNFLAREAMQNCGIKV